MIKYIVVPVIFLSSVHSFGKKPACVANWKDIGQLKDSVRDIDLNQVHAKGQISFKMSVGSNVFKLSQKNGKIFAQTPEGDANVSLCPDGKNLKAVAKMGPFKKEAHIEFLEGGVVMIHSGSTSKKAKVLR